MRWQLQYTPQLVQLTVIDDGCGITPAQTQSSAEKSNEFGLRGLSERAIELGGDLKVESTPGQGTKITVHFPIQ